MDRCRFLCFITSFALYMRDNCAIYARYVCEKSSNFAPSNEMIKMDTTLVILGGAFLALYYFGKKKINEKADELQAQINQNEKDDRDREDALIDLENKINNPLPDGDITIYPHILFSNITGKYWGGRIIWQITNKTANTPFVINGILSQVRLNGHLINFIPANSDRFPYKLQGGKMYSASCTKNNYTWLTNKQNRQEIKNILSPKGSNGHIILECDIVLEIMNVATGTPFYKVFRNVKGGVIWVGGTDYERTGSDAKDDPNWSSFVKELSS